MSVLPTRKDSCVTAGQNSYLTLSASNSRRMHRHDQLGRLIFYSMRLGLFRSGKLLEVPNLFFLVQGIFQKVLESGFFFFVSFVFSSFLFLLIVQFRKLLKCLFAFPKHVHYFKICSDFKKFVPSFKNYPRFTKKMFVCYKKCSKLQKNSSSSVFFYVYKKWSHFQNFPGSICYQFQNFVLNFENCSRFQFLFTNSGKSCFKKKLEFKICSYIQFLFTNSKKLCGFKKYSGILKHMMKDLKMFVL